MLKALIIFASISLHYDKISPVTSVPAEIFASNSTQSDSKIQNFNVNYGKKEKEEDKPMKDRDSSGAQDCFKFNVAYEHGQKIPRSDPCEVCLCIDGEIFCWWKQCAEKPITHNGPKPKQILKNHLFKNNNNNKNGKTNKIVPTNILQFPQSFILNHDTTRTKMNKEYLKEKNDFHYQHYKSSLKHIEGGEMLASDEVLKSYTDDIDNVKSSINLNTLSSEYSTTAATLEQSTVEQDKYCIVMGKTYRVGSVLPQETGNCLQCICLAGKNNQEAPLVTCSPHNCPPMILSDLLDAGY